jgi:hypothetical protein|tara:strand:- start:8312 stop:9115 length:804 start_codon:yes stop_codon:yes gene_type:complete
MVESAKDITDTGFENILLVGQTGSGKTTLIRSLPGKVFAYLFDPNAKRSLAGADVDYEEWLPDVAELDVTIKKFNRDARPSDKPESEREPKVYIDWCKDIAQKSEEGFFKKYDWVCFDSLTFLQRACFDRQMYINRRFGGVEELADYRVVGSKISDLMRSVTSEGINILCTGHITEWQDELTKKITTQLSLAGSAKTMIPLMFTQIWQCHSQSEDKKPKFVIQTMPEKRGLQCIRSSISGLEMFEDVTIKNFSNAQKSGIAKILNPN